MGRPVSGATGPVGTVDVGTAGGATLSSSVVLPLPLVQATSRHSPAMAGTQVSTPLRRPTILIITA
jgi:hypothetical protein